MILDFTKSAAQIHLKRKVASHIQRLADIKRDCPTVFANPTALALMLMSREMQDDMG